MSLCGVRYEIDGELGPVNTCHCGLCRTTMLKSFRSLRKLFRRWLPFSYECLGLFSRQDAKNAKFGFIFSFAAFAPLREIFRVLVAAQTRWGLCRKMSGSAFSSGATIPTASFRFIAGK